MGSLNERLLILAICLSVSLSVVTGLRCYVCNYYHLNTSDTRVTKALSAILSSTSDENCKDSVTKTETCRSDSGGGVHMCGKESITAELSVVGVDVKLDMMALGCLSQASASSDRCTDNKTLLGEAIASIATLTSLDGTGCVCSTDLCNGQLSITAEKFCWLAGLFLAVLARQL